MIREERKKKNRRARKSCKIQSTTLEIEAKRVSLRNVREFEIRIVNSGWHSSSILANPGATFSTITAKMTPQITLFLTLKRFRIEKSLNGKRKFNPKLTEKHFIGFFYKFKNFHKSIICQKSTFNSPRATKIAPDLRVKVLFLNRFENRFSDKERSFVRSRLNFKLDFDRLLELVSSDPNRPLIPKISKLLLIKVLEKREILVIEKNFGKKI